MKNTKKNGREFKIANCRLILLEFMRPKLNYPMDENVNGLFQNSLGKCRGSLIISL